MNFKQATDALLESVTLEDLAGAMGASVQALRQARVREGYSLAHRTPPKGWERAVATLAQRRIDACQRLIKHLI